MGIKNRTLPTLLTIQSDRLVMTVTITGDERGFLDHQQQSTLLTRRQQNRTSQSLFIHVSSRLFSRLLLFKMGWKTNSFFLKWTSQDFLPPSTACCLRERGEKIYKYHFESITGDSAHRARHMMDEPLHTAIQNLWPRSYDSSRSCIYLDSNKTLCSPMHRYDT